VSAVEPHESAFAYDPRTVLCGPTHRWQIQCRLWNLDAGPTPKERRQYILARSDPVMADTITRHVTEATVDAKFEIIDTPHVTTDAERSTAEGQS
jgi:hypothetical protein